MQWNHYYAWFCLVFNIRHIILSRLFCNTLEGILEQTRSSSFFEEGINIFQELRLR